MYGKLTRLRRNQPSKWTRMIDVEADSFAAFVKFFRTIHVANPAPFLGVEYTELASLPICE